MKRRSSLKDSLPFICFVRRITRDWRTGSWTPDLKSLFTQHWTLAPFRIRSLCWTSVTLGFWTLTLLTLRLQTLALHPCPLNLHFQSRMEFDLTQLLILLPPPSRSRRELVPPLQGFVDNCPLQAVV